MHACYDAKTGASLIKRTGYERPVDAEKTARAQLAIAEAAFCLGTATGNTNALNFGTNLIDLLLRKFRPSTNDMDLPHGIAEHEVKEVKDMVRGHGPTLWPEAKTFSVADNARAYLLFARLAEQAESYRGFGSSELEARR